MPKLIQDRTKTEYISRLGNLTLVTGGKDVGRHADANIVIGGKTSKFVPNINASKWDDEVYLNINHKDTVVGTEIESFNDGKANLVVGNLAHSFYVNEDGRLEYEIAFSKKPSSNRIEFELTHTKGLQFFRQPSLYEEWEKSPDYPGQTWEDFEKNTVRPDNAVGSYAVYWPKRNNKYCTGKFCHIYRPKLVDAVGSWIWAEMHIKSSKLIIDLPDEWMQKAVYPVTLDPTFGYEVQGTAGTKNIDDQIRGTVYLNDQGAGNVIRFSAYITSFSSGDTVKCAMYNVADPLTNSTFRGGSDEVVDGPEGWNDFAADGVFTVVNDTSYLLCAWGEVDNVLLAYDNNTNAIIYNSTAYGAWPDPVGGSASTGRLYSIHCDFAESSSSSSSQSISVSISSSSQSTSVSSSSSSQSTSVSSSSSSESISVSSSSSSESVSVSSSSSSESISFSSSSSSESVSISSSSSSESISVSFSSSSESISFSSSSSSESVSFSSSSSSESVSSSSSSESVSISFSSSSSSESVSVSFSSSSSSESVSVSSSSSSESISSSSSSESISVSSSSSSCSLDPTMVYSRGDYAALPGGDANLETPFTCPEYPKVAIDDNIYVQQGACDEYTLFLWKNQNDDDKSAIIVLWKGKSDRAPNLSTVYLQIYNRNTPVWENLDSNNVAGAGVEFTLSGIKTANLSHYYDAQNWVSCRVYQQAI